METGTTSKVGGAKLASIAGVCLAVFGAASVVAAVGYPEWMWVFVFAGLVVPPVVLVLAVAAAVLKHFSRA